jgi:transcriptional regulator with XRE-family HTH domain
MGAKFQEKIAKRVGEKIRKCRIEKGLSQLELAKKIGVRAPQISKWEGGVQIPRTDKLLELDSVLNVIPKLLAEDEKPSPNKSDTLELQQQLKQMQEAITVLQEEISAIKSGS